MSSDLHHLCTASGCGAAIEAAAIPRRDNATLAEALDDGEDFELLVAAEAGAFPDELTPVGHILPAAAGVYLRDGNSLRTIEPRGYAHPVGDSEPHTRP